MVLRSILHCVSCLYLLETLFSQTVLAFITPLASTNLGLAKVNNWKTAYPLQTASSTVGSPNSAFESSSSDEEDESNLLLLDEAISFNTTCASTILSKVMRQNGAPGDDSIEQYLDTLLSSGPDTSLPFWTRSKRLARFSRRARMASLRRTLDMTTPPPPPPSENDEKNGITAASNQQQQRRRRRRAFMSLLRSLESEEESTSGKTPVIVSLEKKAIQAMKEEDSSTTNLRSRLPEGLETPEYEVLARRDYSRQKKSIEIRRYKPYSTCAVSMDKPRPTTNNDSDAKAVQVSLVNGGGASSFRALAGYLFGKNDKSTAMKMTTPVLTSSPTNEGSSSKQIMEFVLPSEYWNAGSLSEAPRPLPGSGVTLQQKESEERAVLQFGGYASKKEVEKRKQELATALSNDLEWKEGEEAPTVAQYNDPFTVPWRRLNEVSIKVIKK